MPSPGNTPHSETRRPYGVWAVATLLVLASACDAGTGGKAVNFDLRVTSRALEPSTSPRDFVNDAGWRITLDEAQLSLGPIYLWENPPSLEARLTPNRVLRRAFLAFARAAIPSAHAHVGDVFFSGGRVLGEFVEPFSYDVLGPDATFDALEGVQGRARSFSMELAVPRGAANGALDGAQAHFVGTASKAGRAVRFGADLFYPGSQLDRTINEIPLDASVDDFGTFFVRVFPAAFFRGADFDLLADDPEATRTDADGRRWLAEDDQPYVQLTRGVQRESSYEGAFIPAPSAL